MWVKISHSHAMAAIPVIYKIKLLAQAATQRVDQTLALSVNIFNKKFHFETVATIDQSEHAR